MTQHLSASYDNHGSVAPITDPLVLVSAEKAKKNQTAELIQLSAILQEMEESIGSIGAKPASTSSSSTASNAQVQNSTPSNGSYRGNLGSALAQAAYYLEMIEGLVAGKYNQSSTESDNTVMQAYSAFNNKTIADEASQCQQIQAQQEAAANESFWQRVFSVIATVIVAAISILCGQPEIALLTIGLLAMNETGATSKIMGNSIYATIAVLAVVSILSFGAGSAATVETEAEEVAQTLLARAAKLLTPSLRAGLVIQNDVQVLLLSQSQGLQNILQEIPMSTDEKQKLTTILTYILTAIAILTALTMSSSMVNAAQGADEEATTLAGKLRNAIKALVKNLDLNNPAILSKMEKLQRLCLGIAAGLQVAQGVVEVKKGEMTQVLGTDQAILGMLQSLMIMLADMVQSNQTQINTLLKGHQTSTQAISSWLNAERAFAQMFGR